MRLLHVQRVQFDVEYGAYRDVWDSLIEVANCALKLRPAMDTIAYNRSRRCGGRRGVTRLLRSSAGTMWVC
jgi:hypothetical protein